MAQTKKGEYDIYGEYNEKDYYDYLLSCGFNEEEAKQKIKDRETFAELYFTNPKEPREITSSTYKRAEKRLYKEVETVMGFDRR